MKKAKQQIPNTTVKTPARMPGYYFVIRIGRWKLYNFHIYKYVLNDTTSSATGAKTRRYEWLKVI